MQRLPEAFVSTRDGVQLATDIYLPRGDGPWPTILERTPYDKSAPSRSEIDRQGRQITREAMAESFTMQGFAVVFQDCRGRYGSTGVFIKYVHEAEDGRDTLDWIKQQAWSDGRVGTMGLSYAAHTQLALACLAPQGLCCMVLDSGGFSNAYESGIRQGGAFELKQATWAFNQARLSPEASADPLLSSALKQESILDWFQRMPWIPGHSPLRHLPAYEHYLFTQWRHGTFDRAWQTLGIYARGYYDAIPDIPMLFVSSWYDAYVRSTLENYRELKQRQRSDKHLIMGSWLHGDRNISHSGDVEFGEASPFDGNVGANWLEYRIRWFERYLQGHEAHLPPVRIFMMGNARGDGLPHRDAHGRLYHGGQWIEDNCWPPAAAKQQHLYLTQAQELSPHPPEAAHAARHFVADPANPVPTIGGALTSGRPVFHGGAFDQRELPDFFGSRGDNAPLSARQDVLSFQTPPLEQDLLLTGDVSIELFVETDAPDTDFTAKLLDVYPPSADYPQGYAMNITDGIFRCRYHRDFSNPEVPLPSGVIAIRIEPFASCNLFRRGHRLRLDIAGSNFPRFDVNPNSGEPEGEARLPRRAHNTVHVSSQWPSRLTLTVVADSGTYESKLSEQ